MSIKKTIFLPIITMMVFFISSCTNSPSELKAFTTDGCSMFIDGTPKQKDLWLHCCTAHDRDYWIGGTYEERKASDKRLDQCVSEVFNPALGKAMRAGVRAGGSPYWPTSFRWGYGWDYPRFYGELSEEETKQVELAMKAEQESGN